MDLYFLGTGSGVPSKKRNVSSFALQMLQERGTVWLFDCGEATQHQILHTSIKPRKIEKIFITHLHGDHIFGLPGLLGSRSFQGGTTPLEIYGPKGIEEYIHTSLRISCTNLTYPIHIKEISEGIVFDDKQLKVTAKRLYHGIPSFGYKIEEKDQIGELLPNKLRDKGIMPGPIYKQLKDQDCVTLADGKVLFRKDFVGPPKKGKVLTIFGDTRYSEELIPFVNGTDLLIHEATFAPEEGAMAHDYYHSTAEQAAILASKANVNKLILNHISSRYQEEDMPKIHDKVKEIFPNTIIVNDFDQIKI
ncbi:ribonuclease Z [Salirhabdus euzebyi]|uniref:Ribonuclease Z n=1 Tax=Salirhabdus euzebyi TaxID=394506 RepID=A0A841QAC1_9BACI|nr:ribonuclease Z [Salirhabdus euzebyi]MBB6455346.1 ribonuclease Z [Salirhabdus euzebyi]